MGSLNLSLSEWETIRPDRGNVLAGRKLDSDANRELAERLAKTGAIEVLELARRLDPGYILRRALELWRTNCHDSAETLWRTFPQSSTLCLWPSSSQPL